MISDFFPNKIYAEIIEISDFIFFALFWVPENAQTRDLEQLFVFAGLQIKNNKPPNFFRYQVGAPGIKLIN